jgi:hypothetical protein
MNLQETQMKKLIDGKVYWIKHKEIGNRCEGRVSKAISDKMEISIVTISQYNKKEDAYFCIPFGRDVLYGLSVNDIEDAALVECPLTV